MSSASYDGGATRIAPWTRWRSLLLGIGLLGSLVALAMLRSHHGTQLDALTIDEAWHVVAGVEYAQEGDYRLNPEHPPLTKRWVGAWMGDDLRRPPRTTLSGKKMEREFVEQVFYLDNDFRKAQSRAQAAMRALNGLLLLVLGILVWRSLGLAWSAGMLGFLALEPTVSAHLPLVMTDLPLALALGIAAVCAGRWIARPGWLRAAGLGLAMGVALSVKHSALPGLAAIGLLCTVVPLSRFVRELRQALAASIGIGPPLVAVLQRASQLLLAVSLAVGVLWGSYGFRFHASPAGQDSFNTPFAAKLEELRVAQWRDMIESLDAYRVLPRAYLWGLADTVRVGVEGRGQNLNLLWGRTIAGAAPWYTFPSYIAAKVPLALLAMALLGALALRSALRRGHVPPEHARAPVILALGVLAAGHLVALAQSQGTYAGVRHALPIVVALAVLGASVFASLASRGGRILAASGVTCLALTLAMTIREPRLWEYHNELAGGTSDAWRTFGNEGLDLGQRAFEIATFHDTHIAPSGKPMYSVYQLGEARAKALGLRYAEHVESIDDTNREGVFEGWFLVAMSLHLPVPEIGYDPTAFFAGLERVARFGYVEVWRGRQLDPKERALALGSKIMDYVYKEGGRDWDKVATRSAEVLEVIPQVFPIAIERGNALLRLGRRDEAIAAYRQPLEADLGALDALTRAALEKRVAELASGADPSTLAPLSNPWLE